MLVSLNFAKFLPTHLGGSKVKTLRKISAASILSLTLAISVMAGQVDTPGVVAPPPPTSSTTQTTGTTATIILTVLSLIYP
jgi:hypothetical protein